MRHTALKLLFKSPSLDLRSTGIILLPSDHTFSQDKTEPHERHREEPASNFELFLFFCFYHHDRGGPERCPRSRTARTLRISAHDRGQPRTAPPPRVQFSRCSSDQDPIHNILSHLRQVAAPPVTKIELTQTASCPPNSPRFPTPRGCQNKR